MDTLKMSPFGSFIGIEIIEYGAGKARCSLRLQAHHMNTGGRVHGGVLSSLVDTCAGVAVRSVRPAGTLSATTDLNIAFIRPPLGDSLEATAEVIHTGRRLFRVAISVHSAQKLVATSAATFMLVAASEE